MSQAAILLIGSNTAACSRSRTFEQVRVGDALRRVSNANEALNFLQDLQARQDRSSIPVLVIVCSTVGSTDRETLVSWMRHQKDFAQTPVLVLATVVDGPGAKRSLATDSEFYLVNVDDTETLLDMVSKHLPERGDRASTHTSSR